MDNLLRAERYKLVHRGTYWIGLAAMAIFGFLNAGGYINDGVYWGATPDPIAVTSFSGLFNSMASDSLILTVIVTGILSLVIGQDFHKRTLIPEVSSGHKRSDIILSRIIVNVIAYNIIMLAFPLFGTLKAVFHYGAGNILDNIFNILRTGCYMILMNSALFGLAILLAVLFKNGVISGIVTTVICFVLTYIFAMGMEGTLAFAGYVLPFYHFRKVIENGSSISGAKIISFPAIIVCALWMVICGIIMLKKFAKSDLK